MSHAAPNFGIKTSIDYAAINAKRIEDRRDFSVRLPVSAVDSPRSIGFYPTFWLPKIYIGCK